MQLLVMVLERYSLAFKTANNVKECSILAFPIKHSLFFRRACAAAPSPYISTNLPSLFLASHTPTQLLSTQLRLPILRIVLSPGKSSHIIQSVGNLLVSPFTHPLDRPQLVIDHRPLNEPNSRLATSSSSAKQTTLFNTSTFPHNSHTMPSRGQLLKFPEVVHKSASSNDEATKITKITEIAPGIFASNHEAEQRFWQHQASHMQKLAKSANVKKKYQAKMNTLKKDVKVARSELRGIKGQLSAVLPSTEEALQVQICAKDADFDDLPKSADEPEQASAKVKHEQSETVRDLRDCIGRLETAFATVTLQRDGLQNELDASEASFTDISDEFSKYHDELENIKSKALVWQAAIEQSRVEEEKQRRAIDELESQLTKSNEQLEAERAESNTTGVILRKTSARLGDTQTLLKMSESKLLGLQAECDILQQERTAATKTQADLVYAAHAKILN
jgi:archaellum component FlaC